jgi:GNAT superfamily N-acetyltransferase
VRIHPFAREHLPAARRLCQREMPYDHVALVIEEKLIGENPPGRSGRAFAALDGDRLIGVASAAGRWAKILVVDGGERRRGVGTALLSAMREGAGGKLRVCDHPGNYLSPGLDARNVEARIFLTRRGFKVVGEVENLRAPLENNPLVTPERSAELDAQVASAGYTIARVGDSTRAAVLEFVGRAFAPVWAFEAARALGGPCRALHAVFSGDLPVAFAAADGNNQGLGWFGPAGTDPAHRGNKLGEALLLRCLLDVRALPEGGVIAWIGPKAFYEKACGAKPDRRFVVYEES